MVTYGGKKAVQLNIHTLILQSQIPAWPLPRCVTWNKPIHLSEPLLPCQSQGEQDRVLFASETRRVMEVLSAETSV